MKNWGVGISLFAVMGVGFAVILIAAAIDNYIENKIDYFVKKLKEQK